MKRLVVFAALTTGIVAFALALFVPGGRAQVTLTGDPAMTKGAPGAAVTIVEFSDYQ